MYLAVDIGGTKTLVAVFDNDGNIIEQQKFSTPQAYEDFKIELTKTVAGLSTKDFERIGLAAPGKLDRQRGIGIAFGNLAWKNTPLVTDIENLFHCPVNMENDAKLAGLSEAKLVNEDFKKVLYITISTGIGYALVNDGFIDVNIGDGGGNTMFIEYKGKSVRWESFASGKAIVERYGKRASEIDDPRIWKRISHDLSLGMIELISVTEPEVIIIGGGVGAHFKKYEEYLISALKRYETPLQPIPPILQARHPEEAVIYGCYEFAKQYHENPVAHTV